jgi:hypothetical protein
MLPRDARYAARLICEPADSTRMPVRVMLAMGTVLL